MKYFFYIISISLLLSCQEGKEYNRELQQIDSVKYIVQESIQNMNAVSNDSMQLYLKELEWYYKNTVPKHQEGDVRPFWTDELKDLNYCKKIIGRYFKEQEKIKIELGKAQLQLENLEHDLRHHLVQDSLVERYMLHEFQATQSIMVQYDKRVYRALQCFEDKDSLLPRVDRVYQILKEE